MKMAEGEHMDEFLNADALKNIEQNDIMKDLNAMKDAFNKGDLNEALEAAQRMLTALQGMMNQMKSSAQKHADSSFSNMLNDANQLLDKISEVEKNKESLPKTQTNSRKTLKNALQNQSMKPLNHFSKNRKKG